MEQIKVINNQAVKRLMDAFPGSFINHCFEFIADIRINSYIRLDNVPDELTLKAKVIEYFSRPAFKGEYFRSHSKNQEIYDFHLRGLNEFLHATADDFRSQGAKVDFVHGMTYWDYCTKILIKGYRAGCMQSYPCYIKGKCGFNRDSKSKACSVFAKTLKYDFIDVGLCADELDRKKLGENECSILQELGITKEMAFTFCKENGKLSPVYKDKKRDGYLLCPNGTARERLQWFEDYKEYNAKEHLIKLQRILKQDAEIKPNAKQFYPLRGYRYFIENEEFYCPNGTTISIFGENIN